MIRRLLALAVALGTALCASANAASADRLAGIVLMVQAPDTALIHHDAFGGMPAMTMKFRLPAHTVAAPRRSAFSKKPRVR